MKQMRIERNRWIDPIDDFVRRYGRATPRWAVFLTYNIDLEQFSRVVLPALVRQGRRFRTVVLSDQGTLEQSLREWRPRFRGAVNLHKVGCKRGVFHPKLVFLRRPPCTGLLRVGQYYGRRDGLESRTLDIHGIARDSWRHLPLPPCSQAVAEA